MIKLPRHGTRTRYRRLECRCVACTRRPRGKNSTAPTELTWPFKYLECAVGVERIRAWYSETDIDRWKTCGLGDFEADEVAIHMGYMAHDVWPGWTVAGLDADVYP